MDEHYDVVIAGGGVAGLTCARHLLLDMPHLKIALVERQQRPLPRFAHKVGESSLAPQGNYLANTLKLRDYLETQHVEKFGVRYFFSDAGRKFSERPELGGSEYLGIREFQFDRGKLENDLRAMNAEDGAHLLEGFGVRRVDTDQDGHIVHCQARAGDEEASLRCRWLIDATGRRRLIHGREGVERGECSAAWWRVEGWIDVEDFVGRDEQGWKSRVSSAHPRADRFGRVNSTIHLCGPGYWVWLIPLPDDGMSIGIVATESLVPFEDYNTYPKALSWLAEREPELAARLQGLEILDFKFLRNYSYPANEILPPNRIGVVGEAVGFSDPFYSPGGDAIALANSLIVEAIRHDQQGTLEDQTRAKVNRFFSTFINGYTAAIHSIYPCLGASRLAACHVVWDFCSLIWVSGRLLNERDLIGRIETGELQTFLDRFLELNRTVDRTCLDYWDASVRNGTASVPPLPLNKLVNHHAAFSSLMRNTDRILRRPSERLRSMLGRGHGAGWDRERYLETLTFISVGLQAYLEEQAAMCAGGTGGTGHGPSSRNGSELPADVAPPGLVENITDYLRWTVAGLGPAAARARIARQLALKWWKAGLQDVA